MGFQKGSLYLIFSIQFLAWLVYMDSLLIKQVFIELYFTLGSLLADADQKKNECLSLENVDSHEMG